MEPVCFLDVSPTSHFSLQNLPYGVFTPKAGGKKRIGVALGSSVVDLAALSKADLFAGPHLQQSRCFDEVAFLTDAFPHGLHRSLIFSFSLRLTAVILREPSTPSCLWAKARGPKLAPPLRAS